MSGPTPPDSTVSPALSAAIAAAVANNPAKQPSPVGDIDNQNYDIDIDKLYQDWIVPTDEIRSVAAVNLTQTFDKLSISSNKKDITAYGRNVTIQTTPQESRCHAFYRLIGFPITQGHGSGYFNPGLDIYRSSQKTITNDLKITIAKDPITTFNALSLARENFVQDNLSIFSIPQNISSSLLALSSGGTQKLRLFAAPFNKSPSDPFSFTADMQSYDVDLNGIVGDGTAVGSTAGGVVPLDQYQDAGGNGGPSFTPDAKRMHIIAPFVVDARIDFTVMPQSNLVAVPFVLDDSYLKVSSTQSVKRPLIEKFIRDQQPINDPIATALGSNVDAIQNYINNQSNITNSQLIEAISTANSSSLLKQSTQAQFIDTLNIINGLMQTLINARNLIRQYQGFYYWVPVINVNGPEAGVTVQGVFFSSAPHPLATPADNDILIAYFKDQTNKINLDTVNLNGDPSSSSYQIATVDISNKTATGTGDNNAKNLETLSTKRTRLLTKAGEALQTIEMIMGEFSGFGLCDAVAITGALKLMDLPSLYGLLDPDAQARMKIVLPSATDTPVSYTTAMTKLTTLVQSLYNLMDSVYQFLGGT